MPLFNRVKLAERFDIAIMSTKGMSVTAARLLVDDLCGNFRILLLVLRDFDKARFSIAGTLQRDTRRYTFQNAFDVVDLGLRIEDVENCGLESEEVVYGKSNPKWNLLDNGATGEEVEFLLKGQGYGGYWGHRVELNAFTSQGLIDWIEGKLQAAGVKKVIPEQETVEDAYREAFMRREFEKASAELLKQAREEAKGIKVPESMINQVKDLLKKDPELSWDSAIELLVYSKGDTHD